MLVTLNVLTFPRKRPLWYLTIFLGKSASSGLTGFTFSSTIYANISKQTHRICDKGKTYLWAIAIVSATWLLLLLLLSFRMLRLLDWLRLVHLWSQCFGLGVGLSILLSDIP